MQNDPYSHLPASLRSPKSQKLPAGTLMASQPEPVINNGGNALSRALMGAVMGPIDNATLAASRSYAPEYDSTALADYLRVRGWQEQHDYSPSTYADLSRSWAVNS